MELKITIADKDGERVLNQAADSWGYIQFVLDPKSESKSEYVLRHLKNLLIEAAKAPEVQVSVDVAKKAAEEKFDREVIIDAVSPAIPIQPIGGIVPNE